MNARPTIDMMEALRLTREGRLAEAMAVLRGELAEKPAYAPPSNTEPEAREPSRRPPPVLDMVPPTSGSGGFWTLPSAGETTTSGVAGIARSGSRKK